MARPKQAEIPGTERPRIEEIETAADFYREKRDARMTATTEEVNAKDELRKVAHEHEEKFTEHDKDGNPFYRLESGESVVLVRSEEDVKLVKPKKAKKAKEPKAE